MPRSPRVRNIHQDFENMCTDGANDMFRSPRVRNIHQDFVNMCADGADMPRSPRSRHSQDDSPPALT